MYIYILLMKFNCTCCNYSCNRKSLWEQHISTLKHMKNSNIDIPLDYNVNICNICNKIYKSRSGLWKHQKTCIKIHNKIDTTDTDTIENNEIDDKKILVDMMNQIKEQNKIISDMIPKIGNNNNNNQFNINVFLNEKCNDAINMSEFIESIKIQLEDLNYTKINGLSQGISYILMNGLKQLDLYKRPIHCSDIKRETLYIKDNDEWDKENGKMKIHVAIKDIANKQRIAINDWEDKNPNWNESDKGKDDYIKLMKSLMTDITDEENKIIKNIAKETIIDK